MSVDDPIETREGLALASAAWREGAAAMARAMKEAEETGLFERPANPYSAQLLRMIMEEDGAR
jgi:hypothetical protein